MSRALTDDSSLDNLKKEAKRWLKALRASDPEAHARVRRAWPPASPAPASPGLRDVQYALALEHGLQGWTALSAAVAEREQRRAVASRGTAHAALLAAADRGDVALVITLLDAYPDIVSERGALDGHSGLRTALHFAVGGAHVPVVRVLLERGADPNVRDEGDAAMPLHFAAEKEHLEMIRLLIERGADPIGEGDHHELEVIGWATCFGSGGKEVVDYLTSHGARHNIFSAVAMGETAIIRAIAARSPADLDRPMDRTNQRRRPLHLAVVKQQPAALATLLDLGADTGAEDAAGLTPLDQAAFAREADMARLLIERGAAIRLPAAIALQRTGDIGRLLREEPGSLAPGGRWQHLILRASERASGEVVETLLRAGASVDVRDDTRTSIDSTRNFTPLHGAAWFGNAEAAAVLLRHGASVRVRDGNYQGTPAGWAAYNGKTAVRDLILKGPIDLFEAIEMRLAERIPGILASEPDALERPYRAYLDEPDGATAEAVGSFLDLVQREGWRTPLAFAVAAGDTEAVRLLLEHGADPTVRDPDGRTLPEIARDAGHEPIVALLTARASRDDR